MGWQTAQAHSIGLTTHRREAAVTSRHVRWHISSMGLPHWRVTLRANSLADCWLARLDLGISRITNAAAIPLLNFGDRSLTAYRAGLIKANHAEVPALLANNVNARLTKDGLSKREHVVHARSGRSSVKFNTASVLARLILCEHDLPTSPISLRHEKACGDARKLVERPTVTVIPEH
jgi:hypothetical protein